MPQPICPRNKLAPPAPARLLHGPTQQAGPSCEPLQLHRQYLLPIRLCPCPATHHARAAAWDNVPSPSLTGGSRHPEFAQSLTAVLLQLEHCALHEALGHVWSRRCCHKLPALPLSHINIRLPLLPTDRLPLPHRAGACEMAIASASAWINSWGQLLLCAANS